MSLLHPWETILSKLNSRFRSIVNVSNPVADGSNTSPPAGLSVVSSGQFTGTAKKQYKIEISNTGVSGVAECTIVDITDDSDTLADPVVITSGEVINLGTLGAKICFTFGSAEVLTDNDRWVVTCDTFNLTVKDVIQADVVPSELSALPGIAYAPLSQTYNQPDGNKYRPSLRVAAEMWVQKRGNESIATTLAKGLADIEHVIADDPTLDGTARDVIFIRCDPDLPIAGRPIGVISLEMDILFHHVIQ